MFCFPFPQVINILASDAFSKYVCIDCEQKIYTFDEFCLTVANVQKQLTAPALEINFAEVCVVSISLVNFSVLKIIRSSFRIRTCCVT